MTPVLVANLATSVMLALLRVLGYRSAAFQAIAHLYVGGLFGAWLVARTAGLAWLYIALALSAVELACFLVGIGRRRRINPE